MRKVIVNMKNYIFADAIAQSLQTDPRSDFTVQRTTSTEELLQYSNLCEPYAVLMEVNGYPPYVLAERLIIRDEVKKVNPDCKIVLVVDENSEKEVAAQVRQAKKDGRIDQFIYGSISANYLVALMDTL
ncbi:MAG: hypothetical protein GX173_06000 [Ruminococcaceae bacterium]|nr:hypothetical protein [Oscillospiraceae bacterium]